MDMALREAEGDMIETEYKGGGRWTRRRREKDRAGGKRGHWGEKINFDKIIV